MANFTPVTFDETKTFGPDVSFYQDDNGTPQGIDFNKMKARGAKFVIIRAGQNTWADPDFATSWKAAYYAGIPRGAYWYLDVRSTPKSQAKIYADMLRPNAGEIVPTVDFEQAAIYDGKKLSWGHLYDFMQYFQDYLPLPEPMMIYTGPYFWKERGQTAPSWLKHPLWIAHYGVEKPMIPAPWREYKMWQFTESGPGKSFGVESNAIDLNYVNGDLPWLYGKVEVPPLEVEEEIHMPRYATKITYNDGSEQNV